MPGADGKGIVSGAKDGAVRLWPTNAAAKEKLYEGNWTPLKFSKDGRVLAVVGAVLLRQIPEDVFPRATFPRIAVLVDHGYAPLEQMEVEIVKPIEEKAPWAAKLAANKELQNIVERMLRAGARKLCFVISPGKKALKPRIPPTSCPCSSLNCDPGFALVFAFPLRLSVRRGGGGLFSAHTHLRIP